MLDLIENELLVIDYRERGNSRRVVQELKRIQKNLGTKGESYALAVEQEAPSGPWPTIKKAGTLPAGEIFYGIETWLSQDSAASRQEDSLPRGRGAYGTVDRVIHTSSQRQTATMRPRRLPSETNTIRAGVENSDDTTPLLGIFSHASSVHGAAETCRSRPPFSTETTLDGGTETYDQGESQGTTVDDAFDSSTVSGNAPSFRDQKGRKESLASPLLALFETIFGRCLSGRDEVQAS